MDVRAIDVRFDERWARVRVATADGVQDVELTGARFDAILGDAAALARVVGRELRVAVPDVPGSVSDREFWQSLYDRGGDNWELARPAPPLERWFRQHPASGKRALVVGCGRGNEARLVASMGAQVVAIDFVEDAVRQARALTPPDQQIEYRVRDLFDVARDPGRYDLVVEHCCFCAIDPARRADYVRVMHDVLVEGGELVGLFYAHGRPGGPPFTATQSDIERLFAGQFDLEHVEVAPDSVAARHGQELLVRMRRSRHA